MFKASKKNFAEAKRGGDSEDEADLERIVLGTEFDLLEQLKSQDKNEDIVSESSSEDEDENLQTVDFERYEASKLRRETGEQDDSDEAETESSSKARPAKRVAWQDDDDDIDIHEGLKNATKKARGAGPNQTYKDYLETKFNALHETPKWAEGKPIVKRDTDDEDDDIFQSAGDYISKSKNLPKSNLSIKKCTHLNFEKQMKGIVVSVNFHPTTALGLVASKNMVDVFQVDGEDNSKVQSVLLKDFEVTGAKFAVNDDELIIGSKNHKVSYKSHGYFYSYDLMSGKMLTHQLVRGTDRFALDRFALSPDGQYIACKGRQGVIHVLDTESKDVLFDLKMNADVTRLEFSPDSNHLYSHGTGGRVFIWDMKKRSCLNKFYDEGCITGTSLAFSPNGQFLATGSDVGVVNIYKVSDVEKSAEPKPLKTLMNLTTEVTSMKFNHSSEMFLMASSYKDNAVKCVHVPSFTVFSNFPHLGQNFKRVAEADLSPKSGYLALGNNYGVVNLHRLCHYAEY
ncbi:U3 small nucleolar RNA-associated protein 18 -like protein [Halotydeus destructor]|nr:U3 small nucleolar RNA-associated protein 18 -like protein [Halotydeus destructor]